MEKPKLPYNSVKTFAIRSQKQRAYKNSGAMPKFKAIYNKR